MQFVGLPPAGSVAALRAEGVAQDAGERPPRRAAFERAPEDWLPRAAVESEMMDAEGDVEIGGHAARAQLLHTLKYGEQGGGEACLFRAFPLRSWRAALQCSTEVIVVSCQDITT